ncbi:MAG: dipeptidase [Planctomycetota bacterium]|jgi:acetylornithine deacetylase/succinyl-diaminopimelate desuccinylase-like protein
MQPALDHLEANRQVFLDLLFDFLRIPSVSAQSEYHSEARRAGEFVRDQLAAAGYEASLFEGDGLPTVFGSRIEDPDAPTLLVYGHYDVQPPEPLDLWQTPPFEPTLVDGQIRARGCADDKGPTLALILAAECLRKTRGSLPVNLHWVIEGEEECGGPVVGEFLKKNAGKLEADALVIADVCGLDADTPALCYGLRGLAAFEVTVKGPRRDLHSGTYGGTIANPATALARLIATLHDDDGRVAIEGFYDGVREIDEIERKRTDALPFDEKAYLQETGSSALFGETGFSTLERKGARPTCEVNGIFGGYDGEGSKTIVPAEAGCKLTCRLVPDQDPAKVAAAVEAHLLKHSPPGVTVEVGLGHQAQGIYTDPDTDWAKAARKALGFAFGKEAALTREGGSIPIVNTFMDTLGVQPLLLGTYAPGERAHSPNERYPVEDFIRGIRAGIHLFSRGGT